MINLETEKKLAELLYLVMTGERRIEELRFGLVRHRDFEVSIAFKELDRIGMNSISSNDLKFFLDKNRVQCSSEEAYLIVRQFDSNSDGRLSLAEFRGLVVPSTLPVLIDSRGLHSRLSLDAEFLLVRLLESEVALQRTLECARKELVAKPDFNLMEAFRSIDKRSVASIDSNALHVFIRRNGYATNEMDMQHIMNRIDKDRDGVISYVEFVDSVLPSEPHSRPRSPQRLHKTPLRNSQRISPELEVRPSSPVRTSPRKSSPLRSSPLRSSHLEYRKSPPKDFSASYLHEQSAQLRNSHSSHNRSTNYESKRDNSASYSRQYNPDEKEIVACLAEEIETSRHIENIKNELSLKADFNLIDAFRMFDLNDRGTIDLSDFESFAEDFSIYLEREEIYLFIRRFSHLQDNRLRFSDFTEIFTPSHEEYARLLRNRSAYNLSITQRRRVFSRDTVKLFIELLKALLSAEANSERLRQRLSRLPDFRIQDAFIGIDKDGNGFITVDELKRTLEENNLFPTSKDLKALMQRYDKNKDGRVSLTEFIQEVTPKSPKKYQ